jgi:hypothetical protein
MKSASGNCLAKEKLSGARSLFSLRERRKLRDFDQKGYSLRIVHGIIFGSID